MTMDELLPVYTVRDPATAEILRNALEAEGIPCSIEGGHQGGFAGVLSVRLFVRAKDAPAAVQFLRQHEHYRPEDEIA